MTAPVHQWLCDPLDPLVRSRIRIWANADDVRHVAVMPDVHPAGNFCVGMVIGTGQLVYPGAVGGDIGCGITACRFSGEFTPDMLAHLPVVYAAVRQDIPYNRHRRSDHPPAIANIPPATFADSRLHAILGDDGVLQLGTLGSGNHFLELQIDEDRRLWAMVHSGSRGIGQAVFQFHNQNCRIMPGGVAALDAATDQGQAYFADAQWCRRYAAANRSAIMAALAAILDQIFGMTPEADSVVDCDHNHLSLETLVSGQLWVHRKGANRADSGQRGLIPGSMGTESYHVIGRGNSDALNSSSHGAGRKLSRSQAMRHISGNRLSREMEGIYFDRAQTHALRAEAPGAYKNIQRVMRAQRDLVCIVRRLTPVLNYKAGR